MVLSWGQRVSSEFRLKVLELCQRLGWGEEHPSWLMACIAFETGGTFSPSIRNAAGSGATGLIQFMPDTAEGLGTTTEALASMTAEQQLTYVEEYFKPYASKINSLNDMYMAILFPRAVGKPDDYVLFSEGGTAYRQNAGLDSDKDSEITKAEAASRVRAQLVAGLKPGNVFNPEVTTVNPLAISILTDALPKIVTNLPEIANIFKNPNVAERNVEAISKIGSVLLDTTKATNIQEAVEKVQADPQTAKEVNEALRNNRADLMDAMDRINTMDQTNIKSAREYNTTELLMVDTKWIKLKFIHILSLVFVGFSGVFVSLNWATLTAELKGAVITLMVIAGWNGVRDYWMGSSEGSSRKTEAIIKGGQ